METIKTQPIIEDNLLTDRASGGYHLETLFNENILQEFPELQAPKHIPTRNILRDYLVNTLRTRQADGEYLDIESVCEGLKESLEKATISEERSLTIIQALINTAYAHHGWLQGGGLTLKRPTSVSLTNTQYSQDALEITYEKDLTDSATALSTISEMKQAAVHWYYTNLTGNPDVEDISEAEFDRLVAKWHKLRNITQAALVYGTPAAAALGAGYATGGLSLGLLHMLAPFGGAALAAKLASNWNKGIKGGSRLYKTQLLSSLVDFDKNLEGDKYIKPLEYTTLKEELRLMWAEKPSKRVRFKEISMSDLNAILNRGRQSAKETQKRTGLVIAVASVALGVYLHGGVTPDFSGGEVSEVVDIQPPETLPEAPIDEHGATLLEKFFTYDGKTSPGFKAPEIFNCECATYNTTLFI